jgi:hypothetical protein
MSKIQETIHDLAQGLYKADVIDKKTLKNRPQSSFRQYRSKINH